MSEKALLEYIEYIYIYYVNKFIVKGLSYKRRDECVDDDMNFTCVHPSFETTKFDNDVYSMMESGYLLEYI